MPYQVDDRVRAPWHFARRAAGTTSGTAYAYISTIAQLKSEEEGLAYLKEAKKNKATHLVYKSVRGAVVGQRELKKTHFDDLFSINHTFATIRAKVNRLNRRTWCTTKDPQRLADLIDTFIDVFCDRLNLICLSPQAMRRQANHNRVEPS